MASNNMMVIEYRVGNYVVESGRVIIYGTSAEFCFGWELKKRTKCDRMFWPSGDT
jgi:hypothetical protein